jgi:hypothetical protein
MAKNIVTIDGIPVYQALVEAEGDTGMLRISLVDDPAVQSNFLAFKKAAPERAQLYAVQDEEKRLVLGVVMRADYPIYRRDGDFEYYIIYKADTIRTMAEKYLVEGRQNEVNTMHEEGSDVEGVQMVQYFIKGAGLSPDGFTDIADGSLFAEFHVVNDDVWAAIKDGTYKGFSLEGIFDAVPEDNKDYVEAVVEAVAGKFSNEKPNQKNKKMAKFKGLMGRILRAVLEFGNVTTDKGVLAWDGEEDLKAGDAVYLVDENGERSTPEDGVYTTADGKAITVTGGKVASIDDAAAEVAPTDGEKPAEGEQAAEETPAEGKSVATDKGSLEWDGEDDLKAGDEVFITDEEGNRTAAADGDYKTEDGKTIVVVDGKVAEIKDAEAEVAPQQEQMSRIQRIAVAFSESYDEKIRKIFDAIVALGFDPYGWLAEAGDDYAIFSSWVDTQSAYTYTRFDVAWDAEGNAVVSNPTEVKPAYVPVAEEAPVPAQEFARVKGEKETAEARVTELERQLAEAKQKPAAMSAHQEVQESEAGAKTGNRGLDNISRIMSAK